jgi:broad specificity phosphatase PhoE
VSASVLLVRHARAGERAAWTGDDRDRPLDAYGRRQADWLAAELSERGVARVLSSPYARCLQTVAPLAERLRVGVEPRAELAEGVGRPVLDALLHELDPAAGGVVLCTHGDVMELVLGDARPCAKGAVWLLEWRNARPVPTEYLAPPGL